MTVTRREEMRFVELPGRRSADPFGESPASSSVRVVELDRSEGRTAHMHPLSEEIIYVESGNGHVWVDGARRPIAAGDVIRIPAGAAHATIPAASSPMRLVCFFPHPDLAENIVETDILISEPSP